MTPRTSASRAARAPRFGVVTETVLLLCRRETGTAQAVRAIEVLHEGGGLERFSALAETQHVLGLVLARLDRLLPQDLRSTPHIQKILKPLNPRRRLALLWDLERDRVLDNLQRRGVAPLVLKGAALRLTTYDDPVERQFGDLDVLVTREQLEATIGGFQDAGYELGSEREIAAYREHHFHYELRHPRGFAGEIHWGLFPPSSPFQLDTEAFLSRARPTPRNGLSDVLTPSPEHMLLHLAGQNLENHFSELRRLVDLDRILNRETELDWDYVIHSARAGGMQTVLVLSLELSERLVGAEPPLEPIRALWPPRHVRLHLDLLDPAQGLLTGYGQKRAVYGRLLTLWLTVRWRDRWAQLVDMITHQEKWIWELYDPEGTPGILQRLAAVIKVFAFQGWRYLVGMSRLIRGLGRSR